MTPLIAMLTHYWGLDQAQAQALWQALRKARWSVAQAWRRQVILFDEALVRPLPDSQAVDAVARFLDTSAAPAKVCAVIEALVGEKVLSRQDARRMETKVLAMVDKHGQWR